MALPNHIVSITSQLTALFYQIMCRWYDLIILPFLLSGINGANVYIAEIYFSQMQMLRLSFSFVIS